MKQLVRQIVFSRLHRPVLIVNRNGNLLYVSDEFHKKMPPRLVKKKLKRKDSISSLIDLPQSEMYRLETYLKHPAHTPLNLMSLHHGVHISVSPVFLHEFLLEFSLFKDNIEMYEEYMYHTGSVIRTDNAAHSQQPEELVSRSVQSVSRIILDAADEFIAAASSLELLDSLNTIISKIYTFDSIDILLLHENEYHLIYSRNSIIGEASEIPAAEIAYFTDLFARSDVPLILNGNDLEHFDADSSSLSGFSKMKTGVVIPVVRSGNLEGITFLGFRETEYVSPYYADIIHGITSLCYISYDNFIAQKNRSKLEAEVRRHEKLIALGSIVSGVAHEINNPLSIMQFDLDELKEINEHNFHTELPELVESLAQEMSRIKGLLNQLRDYVKPGFAEERIGSARVDLCSLFKTYPLKIMLKTYRKKGVTIEVNCRQKISASISRNSMEQVLMNLISNAAYAVEDNEGEKRIEIRAYPEESVAIPQVIVDVCDNGRGIKEENLDRIFDPFFTTNAAEGTGLGLSICYSIIKRSGGTIHVSSDPGKETVMKIILPMA